ncbi:glutamic acid-rich protein isoform X2 [Exaiptasia diaphana]|uniref:Matrin-type domain-containing protein n=1 Tax=Exaiptasia diaphana TaxID=2652724 RepID=A0A913X7L2_EXADI|nr:glutamic acid-rich protein isoform X2 [Exaiptasia diaphana]
MAGFNRFGGGGFGSLYPNLGGLGQNNVSRRDDRFSDDRGRNGRGFERRDIDRDFGRRDPSPRRRRFSPDPPYSSIRGRRDDRADLGSYSLDHLGGQDSFSSRGVINPQLAAQQQQQLMAMVQTQSLLAAIQAQASAATKKQPPSLLQGMRMNDRGMDRQNRKRRFSPNRGQMGNRNMQGGNRQRDRVPQGNRYRSRRNVNRDRMRAERHTANRKIEPGKKSDDEGPFEEPYVEENPDEEEQAEPDEKKEESKDTETPKQKTDEKKDESTKEETTEKEETKSKSQEEDSVPKSSMNLAGQNVDKLTRSLFDTHRRKYVCKVCKIMCTKETCFRQHLFGRRHVKTWLENQGLSFEAVIFKKATEEAAKTLTASETPKPDTAETSKVKTDEAVENKEEQPAATESTEVPSAKEEQVVIKKEPTTEPQPEAKEAPKEEKKVQIFDVKYSCDTRKMAVKDGEYITITSINEARVKINGFDTGLNTGGCEFVKAVTGFQCRLCRSFIQHGRDVLSHVKGRKHQTNYRTYIREHPKYEANQKMRNKELDDMLSDREGETVLLYEVSDEEEEVRNPSRYGRHETSINVKPVKYIAAHSEEGGDDDDDGADQSMDDKNDDDAQDENNENGKAVDDDASLDEEKEETQDKEEEDTSEHNEDHPMEDDRLAVDDSLVEDEEEEEKINSEEIADISIEQDVSLSELAGEVLNDEEPQIKKTRATPAARRGRKSARGGAQGGRGRGRGRGTKKSTRQAQKAKLELTSDQNNEDVDFMDGFEVIDEVNEDN